MALYDHVTSYLVRRFRECSVQRLVLSDSSLRPLWSTAQLYDQDCYQRSAMTSYVRTRFHTYVQYGYYVNVPCINIVSIPE
jgi:hypothetical protein